MICIVENSGILDLVDMDRLHSCARPIKKKNGSAWPVDESWSLASTDPITDGFLMCAGIPGLGVVPFAVD